MQKDIKTETINSCWASKSSVKFVCSFAEEFLKLFLKNVFQWMTRWIPLVMVEIHRELNRGKYSVGLALIYIITTKLVANHVWEDSLCERLKEMGTFDSMVSINQQEKTTQFMVVKLPGRVGLINSQLKTNTSSHEWLWENYFLKKKKKKEWNNAFFTKIIYRFNFVIWWSKLFFLGSHLNRL